jgi:hypothetical protein
VYAVALIGLGAFPLLAVTCAVTFQPYVGPSNAPKLYVDGDSITFGSNTDVNTQFAPAYQVRIDRWSGNTTKGMLPEARSAATTSPDVAIFELGTNNPVHGLTIADSQNWLQALNAAFPATTCVIFVTPWSGTANRAPGTLAAIDAYQRATFPHLADWDALTTPADYAGGDGVHPTPSGNLHLLQVYAAAVAACPQPTSATTSSTSTTANSTTTSNSTTTVDSTATRADSTTTTSNSTSTTTDTTTTTAESARGSERRRIAELEV